ncbi:MAG TPA: AI-2E family transporter [Acidimicrobiales bacterium]|nr:AI-2E family transporter [Acidimicrobiales bacterium]
MVDVDDGRQPAPEGPPEDLPLVVEVDPWTFVVVGGAALATMAAFAVTEMAGDVLTGIGVGMLVGVALSPVVGAVQRRWRTSRGLAVAVVGAGLSIAFAALVTVVAPAAVAQLRDFSDELPSTVRDMYSWPIVGERLDESDAAQGIQDWIEDLPADVDDATLADLGERLIGGVLSAVIVLVTALGVMVDGGVVVQRFRALVPLDRRAQADRLGRIVYATFGSYFAGSLFVAALAGFVTLCVGLALAVPLAPVAGLWTTLTNLIPQVGGFLGAGFLVLLALTKGPVQAAVALAVFLAYQNLENHVISPAIVGQAVNLSPPSTMLAALAGAAAGGVPGALVATPLLGAVKAVYLDSRGRMPDPAERRVGQHVTRALRRRQPFRRRSGDAAGPSGRLPPGGS